MRKEGREEEEEGTRRERERERNPTSSFCSHSASNQALSLAILCSYTPPPYSADPCPYSCEEKKKEKMIAKGEGEGGGKKGEGWFFFRFFFFFPGLKAANFSTQEGEQIEIRHRTRKAPSGHQGAHFTPCFYLRVLSTCIWSHSKGHSAHRGSRSERASKRDSRRRCRIRFFSTATSSSNMRRSLTALAATLLSLLFVVHARERAFLVIEDPR